MDLPTSPDNALVKIHPLLILSVIARHSEEGFKTTITAFDNYKVLIHSSSNPLNYYIRTYDAL